MKNVLHILFVFIALSAFGQKKVQLTITPEEISVGQPLTLTVKWTLEGELIENIPLGFIQGNGFERYSHFLQDVNTGEMIQEFVVSINGTFQKAGSYTFGPFFLKSGSKTYASNSVTVLVTKGPVVSTEDFSTAQLKKAAFGIIERSSSKIYEGQALVLNARVFSKFKPTNSPVLRKNYEVNGIVDAHSLDDNSRKFLDSIKIKNQQYLTFYYDKRVLFPTQVGPLEIQPFDLILPIGNGGIQVQSNTPKITVLPLPPNPPSDFIGAVGKFELSQSVDQKDIKQGDVFKLTVTVSGEGNLHNIENPKLRLPKGMLIYGDPIITEDYVIGNKGAKGTMSYEYNVQVTHAGVQNVPAVSISYFDVAQEKYVTVTSDSKNAITIERDENYTENIESGEFTKEPLAIVSELAPISGFQPSRNSQELILNPLFWIGSGIPVVFSMLFFLLVKTKETKNRAEQMKRGARLKMDKVSEYQLLAQGAIDENNSAGFYSYLEKAIISLIIAHCNLDDTVVYSRVELMNQLKTNNVPIVQINKFNSLFSKCDEARYGMLANESGQRDLLGDLKTITKELS